MRASRCTCSTTMRLKISKASWGRRCFPQALSIVLKVAASLSSALASKSRRHASKPSVSAQSRSTLFSVTTSAAHPAERSSSKASSAVRCRFARMSRAIVRFSSFGLGAPSRSRYGPWRSTSDRLKAHAFSAYPRRESADCSRSRPSHSASGACAPVSAAASILRKAPRKSPARAEVSTRSSHMERPSRPAGFSKRSSADRALRKSLAL